MGLADTGRPSSVNAQSRLGRCNWTTQLACGFGTVFSPADRCGRYTPPSATREIADGRTGVLDRDVRGGEHCRVGGSRGGAEAGDRSLWGGGRRTGGGRRRGLAPGPAARPDGVLAGRSDVPVRRRRGGGWGQP